MFDFTPVSVDQLYLFLAAFLPTFFLIAFVLRRRPPFLRFKRSHIFVVGIILELIVILLAGPVLTDLKLLLGLVIAGALIAAIGLYDEKKSLTPLAQFVWQGIIAAAVISFGWTIPYVSDPFSAGILSLTWQTIGPWVIPGSLLALLWLVFLMNAINWFDGLDGLAGGVSTVGFIILAAISLLPQTQDTQTFQLSVIGIGALGAFLIWNAPPARVYLGTSGSWFVGLYLGLVSMVGGGKIATTLLVLALPVIDFFLVVLLRLLKKQPPWQGDRQHHLYHRLRRRGFSTRSIMLLLVTATIALGVIALLLQTHQKLIALGLTAVILAAGVVSLSKIYAPSSK